MIAQLVNHEEKEVVGKKSCSCGRSPTGFCTGLHALTSEQYDQMIMQGHVYPGEIITEEKTKDES